MTRKLRRQRDFDVTLQIKRDDFVNPPREAQRNWLLNKALAEFADDLVHLDTLAARFVPGSQQLYLEDRTQGELADDEIMEQWQVPIMKAMADVVTQQHGAVLEVGFGRGVSASFIQERGVRSHTIIECNDSIIQRYEAWRQAYPDSSIEMVPGKWQDVVDQLPCFDGIFFHTYPLDEEEHLEQIGRSVTFAEHFFPTAARHLEPGGVFTYLTNEIDSLSRSHQRLLFRHFDSYQARVVRSLQIPSDVRDAWWADSMVIIMAVK